MQRTQSMRICFYANSFLPNVGGAQMVLHHLVTQLTRSGETAVVLAPSLPRRDSPVPLTYPVSRYRRPSFRYFGVRRTLVHLMRLHWRHRFQVLHCHAGYPTAYVGATFKAWFGIPLVVRPYGGDDIRPGGRTRRHPWLARRLSRALTAADAVIAQGSFLREIILGLGVAEQRVHVIHNGVDLAAFAHGTPFPHPRPYILGLGNLAWHKGFDILLRAYARLPQPAPDVLIAGPGAERPQLETLACQLGIRHRITFIGFIHGQEKVNLLRSALCLVCPSRREAFSNVILEALAAGLPVIASAVGGNPELLRDGAHGLLFPSEDAAALAQALRGVLDTPALLAHLRAAIPDYIRDFDWPVVAERYRALYRELIVASQASALTGSSRARKHR